MFSGTICHQKGLISGFNPVTDLSKVALTCFISTLKLVRYYHFGGVFFLHQMQEDLDMFFFLTERINKALRRQLGSCPVKNLSWLPQAHRPLDQSLSEREIEEGRKIRK